MFVKRVAIFVFLRQFARDSRGLTADHREVIIFERNETKITILVISKAFFLGRRTVFLSKSSLQPVFSVP